MNPKARTILACALGALALAFALAMNKNCFELGPDGAAWQAYLDYQATDRGPFSQTGVDAHQGDFDAYYPLVLDYTIPGLLNRMTGRIGAPSPTIMYVSYTAALFIVVFGVGRWFGLALPEALLASFIAAFFFPPLVVHREALTFRFLHLNPHWMQLIVFSTLAILSAWALDGKWTASRVFLVCVPGICVSLEILAVGAMVIFTPWVLVYAGVALAFSKSRAVLGQRLLAALLVLLVLALSGEALYLFGMERYSAYNFFSHEFDWDAPIAANMSIFFRLPYGRLLVVLGILGALLAVVRNKDRLRQLGVAHVIASSTFFTAAVVFFKVTSATGYRTSAPLYFETTLMPFAAIFSAYLMSEVVRFAIQVARRGSSGLEFASPQVAGEVALWAVLVSVACYNAFAAAGFVPDECRPEQLYRRIDLSKAVAQLRDAIALRPGSMFRGNEATIDWVEDKPWVNYGEMNENNRIRANQTGNDSRLYGLWHYDIPTMYQYFTFITAPYYLFMTEYLSRPQDRQTRSGLILTHIDARILRLLGVRYVITDHPTDAGREIVFQQLREGKTLHVIELSDPNLGTYSPTEVRRVTDFHSGLSQIHASTFDGRTTVISDMTDPPMDQSLVAATDARLTYETYGFRVQARSAGTSVLIVPAQFSRCWSVEGTGSPRLFRANLLQLGVLFSGGLDARLVFRYGPLFAASCRLKDVADIERLDIAHGRVVPRTY